MLLEPPNQLLLLVALGGPIRLLCRANRGCGIFQKNSTELCGVFPIQPMPECLSASSATAVIAVLEGPLPPQSIRIDLWALEIDPDPIVGSDPS